MRTQKTIWCLLAIVSALLITFHIVRSAPAFAGTSGVCPAVHGKASDAHDYGQSPSNCCAGLHCCPIVQGIPTIGLPVEVDYRPVSFTETSAAFNFDRSLDPPPRTKLL